MASNKNYLTFTLPMARFVGGDLYKPRTHDDQGQPLVYKTGRNAGQPRSETIMNVAIPKGGEQHWNQTAWGQQIANFAAAEAKGLQQRPDFAWKIIDGDSTVMMQNNQRPCDNPNYKGHWVVRMKSNQAPKLFKFEGNGAVLCVEPGFIKKGYFVEVNVSFSFNDQQQKPGLYANLNMVCFRYFGEEITGGGVDVAAAGFGQSSAMPAGASAAPVSSVSAFGAPAPAPVNVAPNVGFVQNAAAPIPPAPVAPAAAVGPQMAPGCQYSYEALKAQGWSDDQMRAAGYLL